MSTTVIPAGWYPDPAGGASARWWSGEQWTAHTRAPAPAPAAQPASIAPVAPIAPQAQPVLVAPVAPVMQLGSPAPTVVAPAAPAAPLAQGVPAVPAVPVAPPWVHGIGAPPAGVVPPADRGTWHGSPDTVGIWLLAFAPLMTFVVVVTGEILFMLAGMPAPNPVVLWLPVLAAEWVFAGLDRASLGRRGFRRPAIWWMLLLPPLVYFIVRGRRVRERGARAWPPELAYFLQIALSFVLNMLLTPLLMR